MSDWKIRYLRWGSGPRIESLWEDDLDGPQPPRIGETIVISDQHHGEVRKVEWFPADYRVDVWVQ